MSQRYLLPCSCGRTISVGTSQAGSSVLCECGQTVSVPTIRGLKALAPEKSGSPAPAKIAAASEFNGINLQGALFVIGFVFFVAGACVAGYYGYVYSQIDTKDYTEASDEYVEGQIDKMGAAQLLEGWEMFNKEGLGEHNDPMHVLARQASSAAFRYSIVGGGLALAGAILGIYSVAAGPADRRST